jgi:hypothetical protein
MLAASKNIKPQKKKPIIATGVIKNKDVTVKDADTGKLYNERGQNIVKHYVDLDNGLTLEIDATGRLSQEEIQSQVDALNDAGVIEKLVAAQLSKRKARQNLDVAIQGGIGPSTKKRQYEYELNKIQNPEPDLRENVARFLESTGQQVEEFLAPLTYGMGTIGGGDKASSQIKDPTVNSVAEFIEAATDPAKILGGLVKEGAPIVRDPAVYVFDRFYAFTDKDAPIENRVFSALELALLPFAAINPAIKAGKVATKVGTKAAEVGSKAAKATANQLDKLTLARKIASHSDGSISVRDAMRSLNDLEKDAGKPLTAFQDELNALRTNAANPAYGPKPQKAPFYNDNRLPEYTKPLSQEDIQRRYTDDIQRINKQEADARYRENIQQRYNEIRELEKKDLLRSQSGESLKQEVKQLAEKNNLISEIQDLYRQQDGLNTTDSLWASRARLIQSKIEGLEGSVRALRQAEGENLVPRVVAAFNKGRVDVDTILQVMQDRLLSKSRALDRADDVAAKKLQKEIDKLRGAIKSKYLQENDTLVPKIKEAFNNGDIEAARLMQEQRIRNANTLSQLYPSAPKVQTKLEGMLGGVLRQADSVKPVGEPMARPKRTRSAVKATPDAGEVPQPVAQPTTGAIPAPKPKQARPRITPGVDAEQVQAPKATPDAEQARPKAEPRKKTGYNVDELFDDDNLRNWYKQLFGYLNEEGKHLVLKARLSGKYTPEQLAEFEAKVLTEYPTSKAPTVSPDAPKAAKPKPEGVPEAPTVQPEPGGVATGTAAATAAKKRASKASQFSHLNEEGKQLVLKARRSNIYTPEQLTAFEAKVAAEYPSNKPPVVNPDAPDAPKTAKPQAEPVEPAGPVPPKVDSTKKSSDAFDGDEGMALANVDTGEVRSRFNLDKRRETTREAVQEWADEAKKITDDQFESIRKEARSGKILNNTETLAYAGRIIQADKRLENLYKSAANASGDEAKRIYQAIDDERDNLRRLITEAEQSGTEWGRAGAARASRIYGDYTYSGMVRRLDLIGKAYGGAENATLNRAIKDMSEDMLRLSKSIDSIEKKLKDQNLLTEAAKKDLEANRKSIAKQIGKNQESAEVIKQRIQANWKKAFTPSGNKGAKNRKRGALLLPEELALVAKDIDKLFKHYVAKVLADDLPMDVDPIVDKIIDDFAAATKSATGVAKRIDADDVYRSISGDLKKYVPMYKKKLEIELEASKIEFDLMAQALRKQLEFERYHPAEKLLQFFTSSSRRLVLGFDLSPVGTQGAKVVLHGFYKTYAGGIAKAFKALKSENGFRKVLAEVRSNPMYHRGLSSGLAVDPLAVNVDEFPAIKELLMRVSGGRIGKKPIDAWSSRFYVGALTTWRMNIFETLAKRAEKLAAKKGYKLKDQEYEALARQVNAMTGVGNSPVAKTLSKLNQSLYGGVFTAPSYAVSNIESLTAYEIVSSALKNMNAGEKVRGATMWTMIERQAALYASMGLYGAGLANLLGFEFISDPNDKYAFTFKLPKWMADKGEVYVDVFPGYTSTMKLFHNFMGNFPLYALALDKLNMSPAERNTGHYALFNFFANRVAPSLGLATAFTSAGKKMFGEDRSYDTPEGRENLIKSQLSLWIQQSGEFWETELDSNPIKDKALKGFLSALSFLGLNARTERQGKESREYRDKA